MSEIERVEYTPVSVRETLILMKDISELMIDLAYSAALFNNRELAEEVMELEAKMDSLVYVLYMNLMLAARDKADAESLAGVAKVGALTNSISDAAAEIAEVVLRGGEPHPVLSMVIQYAEETVETAELGEGSLIKGKTLKEAGIPEETGMWVLVVKRGDRWIRPRPDLALHVGDVVIASGYAEGEEDF